MASATQTQDMPQVFGSKYKNTLTEMNTLIANVGYTTYNHVIFMNIYEL